MATVMPDWRNLRPTTAGGYAEKDVLQRLEAGLPADFTVLHGISWSEGRSMTERHGELDVVVISPTADVLLMEVKSGPVDFTSDRIRKTYGTQTKDVLGQVKSQYAAIRNRLSQAGLECRVHHVLVLTDVQVRSDTVQWPRERIVDTDELDGIGRHALQAFGPGTANPKKASRLVAFFEDAFEIVRDVSALAGRVQHTSARLADGLATWVPRIQSPSGLMRIQGTAGSGKTQLALRLLREASQTGERAAYVCFNRALADHMALLAPAQTPAETFHELALRLAQRVGQGVDWGTAGAFGALARSALEQLSSADPHLDLLVLDEVQDLQPEWVEALLGQLKPAGRAYLLEDPNQQLYRDRVPFDLPDAVTVTVHENFRSPRALVQLINRLGLTDVPIDARSPFAGDVPDPLIYEDEAGAVRQTQVALRRCLDKGFAPEDVAIVTLCGRERSAILRLVRLGDHRLRTFTGGYDGAGAALWTEGEVRAETVRRFKGQAAPAVVLTECDLVELDAASRRLLFVGLTRARLHFEWVISRRTEQCVMRLLSEDL